MPATVIDNPDRSRYEARIDRDTVGYCQYEQREHYFDLPHTVVRPEHRGRGIADQLVRTALDDLRARGVHVKPTCGYVQHWLTKHPEYNDMVHKE